MLLENSKMATRETRRSGWSRREALAVLLASGWFPRLLRAAPAKADVAWLAEVERSPEALPPGRPKLSPLLVDEDGSPITTVERWQRRRKSIRRWWLDFLQAIEVDRRQTPSLTVLEEDRADGVIRQRVSYEVEPGELTEAYLVKPAARRGRRPGIVAFHSTVGCSIRQPAGVEREKGAEKAFGLSLAQRGYVTFCPRNYLWLENRKFSAPESVARFHSRHPRSKGMAKMLFDGMVALNILASLPEVDPARLGVVGHSLGAKETLYLAALDDRVRAAVSSEGGIGTRLSNWDAPWYLGAEVRRADFRHEHHELLALAAPRPLLFLAGESGNAADGVRSWPFIEAAMPVYELYGGAPRLGLFNHKQGHSVPPEAERRIYEWLTAYC
jgi:dienelactone hydrolase